jgi:hypothetical protein
VGIRTYSSPLVRLRKKVGMNELVGSHGEREITMAELGLIRKMHSLSTALSALTLTLSPFFTSHHHHASQSLSAPGRGAFRSALDPPSDQHEFLSSDL